MFATIYRIAALSLSSNGSEDLERDKRIMRVFLAVNCLKSGKSCKNS
jgi:hypothetical protein